MKFYGTFAVNGRVIIEAEARNAEQAAALMETVFESEDLTPLEVSESMLYCIEDEQGNIQYFNN